MRKICAQKILNYKKYKLVFFGDKQQPLRRYSQLCKHMYAVHAYAVVLQEFCSGPSILKALPR